MTRQPHTRTLQDCIILNWGVRESNGTTLWPLVTTLETVSVEEYNGTTYNAMPFMYLEKESPKSPPLFFRYSAHIYQHISFMEPVKIDSLVSH
jgi:hypothetical protein